MANAKAQQTVDPILAACLSRQAKQPERDLTDRITDAVADAGNHATHLAGRLSEAFSGDVFEDGAKEQFLRIQNKRVERWKALAVDLGLSQEQVIALIQS